MPGLEPGIHVFLLPWSEYGISRHGWSPMTFKTWMAGTSPAMSRAET